MPSPHSAPSDKQRKYRADLFRQAVEAGHDERELREIFANSYTRAQCSGDIKFLQGLLSRSTDGR